ncbi:DUF3857 domain-containing protein [bacterium]|nr:DUF3857 domain-containing protein [bacterium]
MKFFKMLGIICCITMLCLSGVFAEDVNLSDEIFSDYDVVILEAKAVFDHTFTLQMSKESVQIKVKYLTPKGVKDYGFHTLEYNPARENIGDIKGKVILPDGKTVKISKSDIMKKKIVKRGKRKRTEVKIVFPALEVGATVELSYYLTYNGSRSIFSWPFQSEMYTLHSEVSFIPWPGRKWGYSMPNTTQEPEVKQTRPGGNKCYTFIRKNIPPLPREKNSLAYASLSESINFYYNNISSTYDDFWSDGMVKVYKKYFKPYLKPSSAAKKIVKKNFSQIDDKEDPVIKVYEYVISHFVTLDMLSRDEENEVDDDTIKDLYKATENADLFKQKYVTNWQATYILASLLKATVKNAMIDVVFYIPWDEGLFDPHLKSFRQFSDMVVKVTHQDKIYWLSPGKRFMPPGMTDWAAKGVYVQVMRHDAAHVEKIPLDKPGDNPSSYLTEVSFDPENGTATLKEHNIYNPYRSYDWRASILYYSAEVEQKEYLENYIQDLYGDDTVLNSYSFENLKKTSEPLTLNLEYTIPYEFEELGDQILVDFPGFESLGSNTFLSVTRYCQVCFKYPYHERQEVTYLIPSGYSISSYPKNIRIKNEIYAYKVDYEKLSETQFKVTSDVTLRGNMMRKEAAVFLKPVYDDILEIRRNKLVLSED